jgi:peptide/nickel transport system ATP-binding protein
MSVLGLLPASARVTGSARLGDLELIGADASVLRGVRGGRIGTIFQEPMSAFDPVYTIEWQLVEALRSHGRLERRAARDRVRELLTSVGIRDVERVARSHPHELSGGQLQRAMIAMALSCNPEVLIADEPTTALDVTVQAGILELIRTMAAERDVAVLLITHDMGVVADLADDVVVMRAGVVVERADAATLFAAPKAEYTRELLQAVPRFDRVARDEARAASTRHVVDVRDLEIDYGTTGWGRAPVHAVQGVSFTIDAGRTFGLVGESGSGKSTIGRALAGLIPPVGGVVEVDGVDLATASRRRLRRVRRGIGYVFQDPASSLNPRQTVGRAISEPLRLHTRQGQAERRARVAELLDAVHLPTAFAERYPHELSGGQRQRVAIARAVALRPALLIADEPTSALDVSVQATVLKLFVQLQRDLGFACLFISHDLAVVQEVAQDVAVLRAGCIVEAGPARRLLTAPQQPYTQRLIAAAPVADPAVQRGRRAAWERLAADDAEVIA